MDKINELKYIHQLSLPKLKRVPSGYMCSCVKCKEGKSPWKTRMYILTEKKSYITVFCQNCGYDTNFRTFVKDFFPYIFEEYKRDERELLLANLKNGTLNRKDVKTSSDLNNDLDLKYVFKLSQKYFKPAKHHPLAVEFCKKRHIEDRIDEFFYNVHPNHTLSGMVIFPFYVGDDHFLYGFQGRHTSVKKFHTHSKNESMKVYNFYRVNFDEPVYIFESIIDSLMIPNSIAMLGVSLSEPVLNSMRSPIFVLDNDKRGIQTAIKYASENKKIFIYPDNFKYKDFNAAVCDGVNRSELKDMIKENTYQGFAATVRLQMVMSKSKF